MYKMNQVSVEVPLKILLADTDYSQFLSLKQLLSIKNGFRAKMLWCGERDQYRHAILTGIYDLVLMDYSTESLFILEQAISEGCRTPVVLLTDQSSDILMMRAAKCGALGVLSRTRLELHSLKYFLLCANMHRYQGGMELIADGIHTARRNKYLSSTEALVHH